MISIPTQMKRRRTLNQIKSIHLFTTFKRYYRTLSKLQFNNIFISTNFTQLKTQTMELLDPVWKENRNKQLLMKMLNLDEPIITAKVSKVFLNITLTSNPRMNLLIVR